jgi:hypothetical protein
MTVIRQSLLTANAHKKGREYADAGLRSLINWGDVP